MVGIIFFIYSFLIVIINRILIEDVFFLVLDYFDVLEIKVKKFKKKFKLLW